MRLSTGTHSLLDYATAGFLLAAPRLLGASPRLKTATTALALSKLGYTLLTRHEGGVARGLSMKTHLALDVASGVALTALPLVTGDRSPAAAACVAAGLLDLAAAAITDPRSLPPTTIPGVNAGTQAPLPAEGADDPIPANDRLPETTLLDAARIHLTVSAPTVALGPIIRRPTIEWLTEVFNLPAGAIRTFQAMRENYGRGPLLVDMPFRHQAVLLDPAHVRRVLEGSPEPFATAEATKQAALHHFEPKVSLISHGPERTVRRQLNEDVLGHKAAVHKMAEEFLEVVDEEAAGLRRLADDAGGLDWPAFKEGWFRVVRRVVFGNAARDDREIIELMEKLRADGNMTFLKPVDTEKRDELHRRITEYLKRGEPGSLAAVMAARAPSPMAAPENQVPQWLFAFDPAGMATFRALALLAAHPKQAGRADDETAGGSAVARPHRPFLRATVLEALRLWPTTPALIRQSTRETRWETGVMPANTSILIYAPFFHRDETRVPFAHAFHPDVWLEDDPEVQGNMPKAWPFVPFSGGPGVCPGRNLVLTLTSGMLAALVGDRSFRLADPGRLPPGRLPGMLDHFSLRFRVARPAMASAQ